MFNESWLILSIIMIPKRSDLMKNMIITHLRPANRCYTKMCLTSTTELSALGIKSRAHQILLKHIRRLLKSKELHQQAIPLADIGR